MTQIQWTKCSERMPQDEIGTVIMRYIGGYLLFKALRPRLPQDLSDRLEWTPYTEQKWKELNR